MITKIGKEWKRLGSLTKSCVSLAEYIAITKAHKKNKRKYLVGVSVNKNEVEVFLINGSRFGLNKSVFTDSGIERIKPNFKKAEIKDYGLTLSLGDDYECSLNWILDTINDIGTPRLTLDSPLQVVKKAKEYSLKHGTEYLSPLMEKSYINGYLDAKKEMAKKKDKK